MNRYRRSLWINYFLTCATLLFAQQAVADMNFNGFATMAGGMTLSSDETLNGYDSDLLFDQNSLLGIQANADLGEGLSAVAQIVSKGRNNWEPEFEWAYIGYEFNENFKLIAGKQRWPFYMYSDYVDVSYAYHWIVPPEAVYNLPFNSATGVGALITGNLGEATSTLHIVTGRNREDLVSDGVQIPTDTKNMLGFSWTLDFDWLALRVGYSTSEILFGFSDVEPLAAAWTQAGWPEFSEYILADDGDESGSFGGFGFTIDHNDYLVVGEYTTLSTEGSFIQDESESYYLSVGKHFDNLLPHITYGVQEVTPSSTAFLDVVPTGVSPDLDALIAGTQGAFNASAAELNYVIVGLRWDFHPSAAFKVEFKSQKDEIPLNETNKLLRFAIVSVF